MMERALLSFFFKKKNKCCYTVIIFYRVCRSQTILISNHKNEVSSVYIHQSRLNVYNWECSLTRSSKCLLQVLLKLYLMSFWEQAYEGVANQLSVRVVNACDNQFIKRKGLIWLTILWLQSLISHTLVWDLYSKVVHGRAKPVPWSLWVWKKRKKVCGK